MIRGVRSLPRLSRTFYSTARIRSAHNYARDPAELDQITTLSNGVRVATEALPGNFSAVGVYVDAGSRYETKNLQGVSHIVDRLAFKSTSKRTAGQMLETIESLGGTVQCASSRESMMYQSASFNSKVPETIAVLAETVRDPLITQEEVADQLETVDYEIGEIWRKPEFILPELTHMAAYKDNTLGNPLLCPQERLQYINRDTVEAYRKAFYRPERMVVAFAGIEHETAVRLSEQHFGDMKRTEQETQESKPSSSGLATSTPGRKNIPFPKSNVLGSSQTIQDEPINYNQPSHYTGGFLTLPPLPIPPNPALPRLSHIYLAFESLPINHPDIYTLATLQTLLGGGGSFSAGGPGKGMYSRLYTNVLNQFGWVESCSSFNHAYSDSGIFGIASSCRTPFVADMLEVMCREFSNLCQQTGYSRLNQVEVDRAKNQLRSSLLINLESRLVELEDIGRQAQVHGRRIPVKEMISKIESVTVDDLRRVAREVFGGSVKNIGNGSGAPTVVLQQGEEEGVQLKEYSWNRIQETIANWGLGRK
ncbi:hypothetical protein K470DRAFT_211407 [Piedraia hortae CBS 480.64]|uniref:Mitochondrial-processing peptidase subunit alpha n=1 Tax=Piedraia hortae CBS 480.64 TaxID=1314780 RepID=A0A6A7C6Z7_9PEZI|nr:hypothetical protein K470DRAFT_211407 [Piedraia hortae CBS 480.64]